MSFKPTVLPNSELIDVIDDIVADTVFSLWCLARICEDNNLTSSELTFQVCEGLSFKFYKPGFRVMPSNEGL
jgi:hypothetical protein